MWKLAAAIFLIASSLTGQPSYAASTRENMQLLAQLWSFTTFATECRLTLDSKSLLCSAGPITRTNGIIIAREWASMSSNYMRGEAESACSNVGSAFLNRGRVQEAIVQGTLDNNAFEVLICLFTDASVKPEVKGSANIPEVRARTEGLATPLIQRLLIEYQGDDDNLRDCRAAGTMLECWVGPKLRSSNSALTRTTRYQAYDWEVISGKSDPIDATTAAALCANLNTRSTLLGGSFEKGEHGGDSLLICFVD